MTAHPDPIEIDRLRAGLLDDDPPARAAIIAHLEGCAACRRREALWSHLLQALDAASADRGAAAALASRRQRLLREATGRRTLVVRPWLAIAAAIAAMVIGVGAALVIDARSPDTTQTAQAPAPDLYADLDFYLWLMHQHAHAPASPNG